MKTFLVAVPALVAGCLMAAIVSADQSGEKHMSKNGLTEDLTKVSDEGYDALRSIHLARLAIFNGDSKIAEQLLHRAQKDLDSASKDAVTLAADRKATDQRAKGNEKPQNDKAGQQAQSDKSQDDKSQNDNTTMIPIDGQIAVADTFVATNDKSKHIEKANEHLKAGRSKEALEELRLGEVDVVFTRVMLPLEKTKKRVAEAEKLVNDHKYYEANMALKAAEDGVVIDAIDLIGTPRHKEPSTAATRSAPKS